MPDRLAELRRQRTLIADHLAWLDREIAGATPAAPPAANAPLTDFAPVAAPAGASIPNTVAEPNSRPSAQAPNPITHSVLPEIDSVDIRSQTKRGCFIYALIATAALATGIWALIWMAHSTWVSEELSPYIGKVTFIALVLILGAAIRSLIAKFRSK